MDYPVDSRDYLMNHKESLLSELEKLTKDFPFNPPDKPTEDPRKSRLEELFTDVRKIALKAFSRVPSAIRRAEDKDDWIQDAFEILCKQTLEYKPAESDYDVYIKNIVRLRLIDKQRAAYRNNPVATETCKPRPAMPAVEGVQSALNSTPPRMFRECDQEELETFADDAQNSAESCPEKTCQDKELMSIVLKCLEKMKPNQRRIVIERYLNGYTYEEIARMGVPKTIEAIRGHAKRGFLVLKNCVLELSGVGIPA